MPKCTITFEDGDDGETKVAVKFDPPIDNPMHGHKPSPAQQVGWELAQRLMKTVNAPDEGDKD